MLLSHHQRRQYPHQIFDSNSFTSNNSNINNFQLQPPPQPQQLHQRVLPLRNPSPLAKFNSSSSIPSEFDIAQLSDSPSSTIQSSPATSTVDQPEQLPEYYMPRSHSSNPPVRIHYSTPVPSSTSGQVISNTPALDDGGLAQASWLQPNNATHLIPPQPYRFAPQNPHRRNNSGSTVTSTGPDSPYTPTSTAFPRILDSETHQYSSSHLESYEQAHSTITSYPKALPSASQPTFTDTFFSPQFQDYTPSHQDDQLVYQQLMREATMAQQRETRMGNRGIPVPRNLSGEFEEDYKPMERPAIPNLDRTMSDIYQDELYNPNPQTSAPILASQQPMASFVKNESNLQSPRRDVFSERLQEANNEHLSAKSASPARTISRDRSPFQPNSRFASEDFSHADSPAPRLKSAAPVREEAEALAFAQHTQSRDLEPPQTISPKDVSLDSNELDQYANTPLFPQDRSATGLNGHDSRLFNIKQEPTQGNLPGSPRQQHFSDMPKLRSESSSGCSPSSSQTRPTAGGPTRPVSSVPQQYPFISHPRRQNSAAQSISDPVPEFPAPLASMESTKSEAMMKSSMSQDSQSSTTPSEVPLQRPTNTTADTGTYTCTYHGCSLRFETPAKLQKHKRDGHRPTTPSSAASASASAVDARNSQAGPHKCERINPSTGKPCNSLFSRPYDLTRHEDTIHNARKQKVRCQLCVEEKTFSRNDALTRHMRVVHPEVNFPGKTKRKGA